jgi:hypothetical protein
MSLRAPAEPIQMPVAPVDCVRAVRTGRTLAATSVTELIALALPAG